MKQISALHFMATALGAFTLLFVAATAQAAQRPITTHVPEAVASGRAPLVGHLPDTQRVSLAVSLPLRNEEQLRELLQRLYDPQSPSYRKYLSVQQFAERFGPAESDYAALQRFAQANGFKIVDVAGNRLVLDIEGSAANVESAFHVSLGLYQHPTEARTFYSTDREPTLDLDVPVLHITGLDNFTLPKAKLVRKAPISGKTTGSGPQGQFLGSDFRAAYYGSGPLNGAGQVVGLYEQAGYEYADIKNYFEKVKQPLNVPIVGVSVNGASLGCPAATCDDGEQSIDIEMAISMAPALDQVIVYVGTYPVSIINKMAEGGIAKQLSCSWGWSDDESRLDPIFEEMAAQGQSFFVATGDYGSASPPNYVWPGDDPLITAVGGTDLVTNGPGGSWASETGWTGSAGMPSKNGVPIPSYQQLPGVINSSNDGSTTLRNIPDVAAEANTNIYSCYDETCGGGNGGTSFAAPQWAGFTALANEQAANNGQPALGFLNPSLYNIGVGSSYDSDFHDLTSGSNGKYFAVVGFDLVTGWGSPNGPNLINTLVGLE
jgi:subtilase family serine protease